MLLLRTWDDICHHTVTSGSSQPQTQVLDENLEAVRGYIPTLQIPRHPALGVVPRWPPYRGRRFPRKERDGLKGSLQSAPFIIKATPKIDIGPVPHQDLVGLLSVNQQLPFQQVV